MIRHSALRLFEAQNPVDVQPSDPSRIGDRAARLRTLLVDLPFRSSDRPSIGLSLLRAALETAGFSCSLRYANLEFSRLIGAARYSEIASALPAELLFGDLVFATSLLDATPSSADPTVVAMSDAYRDARRPWIYDSLERELPHLQALAAEFVQKLSAEIVAGDYGVVGLSLMFQLTPSLALAKAIKARAPHIHVMVGGTHCEGDMGVALHEAFPWLDFVCQGEGEVLITKLLGHLSGEGPPREEIRGLVWRQAGRSVCGREHAERVAQLDELPMPTYHDWLEQRHGDTEGEVPWLPIETSRGCWFGEKQHCTFCGISEEQMRFRSKSPERVLSELRTLHRYGIPNLYAVDMIFDQHYFSTLLPRLRQESLGLTMFFEIKANLNYEQLQALANCGITKLQPGIESLSTSVLRLMTKGVTALQNVRLLKWAAELGIGLDWHLLYGFPGESPEEYQRMAELVQMLTHLQPPRGGCCRVRLQRFSPLFVDAARYGYERVRPASAYSAVLGLLPEQLAQLAYYFDYDHPEMEPQRYIGPLISAVEEWQRMSGRCSFTRVCRDRRLLLFDSRPKARVGQAELSDLDRDIYLHCDGGATFASMGQQWDRAWVMRSLERFCYEGWMVELDGRFLSLAVDAEKIIPDDVPDVLIGPYSQAAQEARMRALCPSARTSV